MKIKLTNKKTNCKAYGLFFDDKGVCECKKEMVQSLIDSGHVEEVKPKKAAK
jgi:hypothetical protein